MTRQTAPRKNPFVGPVPLRRGQPFFGRDRELDELRNLLVAERIVVLYSPSGAGKTSLIQAGLIEALEQAAFNVLPVITLSRPPGMEEPAEANRYLQSTIASLQIGEINADDAKGPVRAGASLREYLKERPRAPDAPNSDVLIFDQFEQVFTLDPADLKAKTDFFQEVGEVLRVGKLWVLFSLREEHLAELDPYRRWIPERLATSFRLEYLTPDEARDAICLTARCGGVDVDKKAADLLINDLSRVRVQRPDGSITEDKGNDIEPVQLQVVCHRLLELLPVDEKRLHRSFVEANGDVGDALREYYTATVARVAKETGVPERDIRTWFDEHLITKQRVRAQVLQGQNESEGLKAPAVRALIDANLVSEESARNARWLELAHDRLISPIIESNQGWYSHNLNDLQLQALIWARQEKADGFLLTGDALEKAKAWAETVGEDLNDDEREFLEKSEAKDKAEHTLRRRLVIAVALAFVATIFALAAVASLRTANINSIRTLAALATAQYLRGDNELGALLARQAFVDESHLVPPDSVDEVDPALGQVLGADYFNHIFRGHEGGVFSVSFDDSGTRLYSGGADGTVRLWDPNDTEAQPQNLDGKHSAAVTVVVAQQGGSWVASGGEDKTVYLEDVASDADPIPLKHDKAARAVAFDPDQPVLATAGAEGCLRLWQLEHLDPAPRCMPPKPGVATSPAIRALAFRPGHRQIYTADTQGQIYCWNMGEPCPSDSEMPATLFAANDDGSPIWSLAFSAQRNELAAVGEDGTVKLWNPDAPQQNPQVLAAGLGFLRSVSFDRAGNLLAVGGDDGLVRIWDLTQATVKDNSEGEQEFPAPDALSGHQGSVNSVVFDAGGRWLASAGDDGTIRLWDLKDPTALPLGNLSISAFAVDDAGVSIAVAGDDEGRIQLWSPRSPARLLELGIQGTKITALAVDPTGSRVASGGVNGVVQVWSTDESTTPNSPLLGSVTNRVAGLAFSADGQWLASSSAGDGIIRVWNMTQPQLAATEDTFPHESGNEAVTTVIFDPQTRWLAAAGTEGTIGVWTNFAELTKQPAVTFNTHDGKTIDMAVDSQFRWLATAGIDGLIKLWPLDRIPLSPDQPAPVAEFTLDAHDGRVVEPGKNLAEAGNASLTPGGVITSIAFSQDGNMLASASDDGSVWLWDLSHATSDGSLRSWVLSLTTERIPSRQLISDELGVVEIAFWSDGRLTIQSGDAVRTWDTSADDVAASICQRVDRGLTSHEWNDLVAHDLVSQVLFSIVEGGEDWYGDTPLTQCPVDVTNLDQSTPQAGVNTSTSP